MAGDRYSQLVQELQKMHDKKALDYGTNEDSLANVHASRDFGIPPWVAALLRINDKMVRLRNFAKKGKLANESAVDSMIDIAVYALIAIVLYEEEGDLDVSEMHEVKAKKDEAMKKFWEDCQSETCQEDVPPHWDRLLECTSEKCHRPLPCPVHDKERGSYQNGCCT